MISNKAKLLFLILENYVNTELKFETYMATVEPRSTVSLSTNDQVTITGHIIRRITSYRNAMHSDTKYMFKHIKKLGNYKQN